jgi:hypothetical protein
LTDQFNLRDWIPRTSTSSSGGLTESEANGLYIQKSVDTTNTGKPTFTNGLESNNYDIDNFDAHIGIGDSKEKGYNDDILKKINSLMISNINSTQNNSTVSF